MFKIIVFLLSAFCFYANAEVVLIVNKQNTAEIKQSDIRKFFLGRETKFSNGNPINIVNLPENSPSTFKFNDVALEKTTSQLKAYWSKLIFTGKATAIRELSSDQEVLDFVASNQNAIGYVDSDKVDISKVRVIPLK